MRFIGIYSMNFAIFLMGALRSRDVCTNLIAQTNTWRHVLALFVWIYLLFLGMLLMSLNCFNLDDSSIFIELNLIILNLAIYILILQF